ncbi:MAG: cupin domain-containing protein [Thermodesulfobacteriota bacterium]
MIEKNPSLDEADRWIELLQLGRHPEGGYYRETYRSEETIDKEHLPKRFSGSRSVSTAIYFLLKGDDFSAFHHIKQDELFHFYDGSSLSIHVIDSSGNYLKIKLGRNMKNGEVPQATVKAGWIFGASVDDSNSYSLVGTTVAPGFDFADFELLSRDQLIDLYPQHKNIIERLTR